MYQISDELLAKLKAEFTCGCCDDAASGVTIGEVFQKHGYVCDPHTAVGWHVADQYMKVRKSDAPVVVLSTASPYKFPAAVLKALGQEPVADEFAVMEQLRDLTGMAIPENLAHLQEMPVLHKDVIDKEEMLDYVLRFVNNKE